MIIIYKGWLLLITWNYIIACKKKNDFWLQRLSYHKTNQQFYKHARVHAYINAQGGYIVYWYRIWVLWIHPLFWNRCIYRFVYVIISYNPAVYLISSKFNYNLILFYYIYHLYSCNVWAGRIRFLLGPLLTWDEISSLFDWRENLVLGSAFLSLLS